ncbi:MAG: metal-dependent hydrolase [Gemmatimonadaceae bacterium]
MDNVTHALAGCLIAATAVALVERRSGEPAAPGFRSTAAILGLVTAELPDADLVYSGSVLGMGKLGYLLHHRGHTHTLLFAVLAAVLAWGVVLILRRGARAPAERRTLPGVALAGTLSHIALDYTNSYGVHPFWPVANSWYYGDALFIIEPWLWIAALPPLILVYRRLAARVAFGVALLAILGAAWNVDMVGRDVRLALTLATVAWGAVVLRARPSRRVAYGLAAWAVVELSFFAGSHAARKVVRSAVGPATLRDVALTPAIGDPGCFRALVVEVDGAAYRVTEAAVAPFPALRPVARCAGAAVDVGQDGQGGGGGGDGTRPSARPATALVRWGGEWSAPRAELVTLARTNCEVAAALRFVRVPVWRRIADGGVRLSDLRFGDGGFASITTASRPVRCPGPVPDWTPPRSDVLGEG